MRILRGLVALLAIAALIGAGFDRLAEWGRSEGRRAAAARYEQLVVACASEHPRFRCEAELYRHLR